LATVAPISSSPPAAGYDARLDLEGDTLAVGSRQLLRLEVDRESRIGTAFGIVDQLGADRLGSTAQDPFFEAVVKKMSAKDARSRTGCRNRAAPTVRARGSSRSRSSRSDQDLSLPPGRPIEHEVGPLAAVRFEAHLGEQCLPSPVRSVTFR